MRETLEKNLKKKLLIFSIPTMLAFLFLAIGSSGLLALIPVYIHSSLAFPLLCILVLSIFPTPILLIYWYFVNIKSLQKK